MTAPEYTQLQAFARVDGLKLFLLWIASFACYMAGLRSPEWSIGGMLLALYTPFMTFRLLRRFRDQALDGVISFGRAWLYVMSVFFYAGLLFAVAQFVYFTYMDKGYLMGALTDMLSDPEMVAAMKGMGMGAQMEQAMQAFRSLRPIDMVLNIMASNLFVGGLLGVPLAAVAQRSASPNQAAGNNS